MAKRIPAPVVMFVYKIYFNLPDYPGRYVVRKVPGAYQSDHATLEEARASLPPWVQKYAELGDEEGVVETWL